MSGASGMEPLRGRIDDIDERLIALIGERLELACELGRLKARAGLAIEDEERERILAALYERHAHRAGLDPDFVQRVFETVLAESKRVQGRASGTQSGP